MTCSTDMTNCRMDNGDVGYIYELGPTWEVFELKGFDHLAFINIGAKRGLQ